MRREYLLPILAVLLASIVQAQQSPSTSPPTPSQVQPATASAAPCAKGAPTPPRKPSWLEKKARTLACAQNKNLCELPSSASEITGSTPEAKPCRAVPIPAPPLKVQAQAIPETPAAAAGSKPAYVCPPKTVLIPGTAFCLTADHTTVDAIPLPENLYAPAPAAKVTAQTKTKQ